ncbi:MAG: ankyrin repeat domain-containing protein, partial [Endozoicomonadaceae bacterium]|nr:ankyrin repeat domain-containing protein [Endozoicomonadaceae bacterium]
IEFVQALERKDSTAAKKMIAEDTDKKINVNYLIYEGFEADPEDKTGHRVGSPLLWACENNDECVVDELLKRGAEVNFWCDSHHSPLINAMAVGNIEIIKKLVEHGADVEGHYFEDGNAIFHSKGYEDLEIVVLLASKIEKRSLNGYFSNFLFEHACCSSDVELIKHFYAHIETESSPDIRHFEELIELGVNFDLSFKNLIFWTKELSSSKIFDFILNYTVGFERVSEYVLAAFEHDVNRMQDLNELPHAQLALLTEGQLDVIRDEITAKHKSFGSTTQLKTFDILTDYLAILDTHKLSISLTDVADSVAVLKVNSANSKIKDENIHEQTNTL